MKLSFYLVSASAAATFAMPGMINLMHELARRQAGPPPTPELIGDLATQGATTPVGNKVKACITGVGDPSCQELTPKVNAIPSVWQPRLC